MDRNSIIGLVLITGIMLGWMLMSQPSKEELERQKKLRDSLELVQSKEEARQKEPAAKADSGNDSVKAAATGTISMAAGDSAGINSDSLEALQIKQRYGVFASASKGEKKELTIENELLKATVSTHGGYVTSVVLKEYKTSAGKPLVLFTEDSTIQALEFNTSNSHLFSTNDFYFTPETKPVIVSGQDSGSLVLRLYSDDKSKYIEYVYGLKGNSYILKYNVNFKGMNDVVATNASEVNLKWSMKTPSQEKDHETQRNASTIYFKYLDDEVDYINQAKDEKKSLEAKIEWVGFKQQFFTSVLMADKGFEKPTDIETLGDPSSTTRIKTFTADLSIPFNHMPVEGFDMQFYFGPNHYKTLKSYGHDLEKQIYLGWSIFAFVNKWIVIPTFNFLNQFNLNYGIIILLLTIFIKIILFPIAYKTYLSSAKMRILKPEIDEINKKFGTDDPMKKQQATMTLYKQAGVNPLAGCIPVLLQLPILAALFSFFPSAIELRQQSFLWAADLSTYDSIYDLAFKIPFYGDHVSLFTLLMTVSTILYTYSNSQLMGSTEQMPGMKFMMYAMPVIFLGVFNNYSAGLSYYYFLANMITFGQTYVMRKFVDEKALHAKIQENKRKPVKQSSFQKRLEEMAKQRQQQVRKK
ncbi:MAG: membrane protein insertase YidC [Bacteroidia bacterium]|nr:membrane protein insertase YidC [Bacteroidia bacterium]